MYAGPTIQFHTHSFRFVCPRCQIPEAWEPKAALQGPDSRLWTWWGLCSSEWLLEREALKGGESPGSQEALSREQNSVLISRQAAEAPHCLTLLPRDSSGHGGGAGVCASTYLLPFIRSRPWPEAPGKALILSDREVLI